MVNDEPSKPSFFSWPTSPRWRTYVKWSLIASSWYGLVYGGCDWVTSQRVDFVRVHLPFEERIPFVPDLIWVYSSIYLLFAMFPFALDSSAKLKTAGLALMLATGIGAISFMLIPAEPDFALPNDLGLFPFVFQLSDKVNLNYNQVPSLHVAFVTICCELFIRNARPGAAFVFRCWPFAVAIAAVMTFQHHIVDVISGYLLGHISLMVAKKFG